MSDTEFAGLPMPIRLQAHTRALADGWRVWIEHMTEAMIGGAYSPRLRTDLMIDALAAGAGRWAADPGARPRRAQSSRQWRKLMGPRVGDPRDHVVLDMVEMLAGCVRGACGHIGEGLNLDQEVKAVLVPLQISALRVGVAKAFAPQLPAAVLLEALDMELRERVPGAVMWWNLAPVQI